MGSMMMNPVQVDRVMLESICDKMPMISDVPHDQSQILAVYDRLNQGMIVTGNCWEVVDQNDLGVHRNRQQTSDITGRYGDEGSFWGTGLRQLGN